MYSKKLFSTVIAFFIIFSSVQLTSYAEIDMEHNYKENLKLLDMNWYVGHCKNNRSTCIKNLIRYESAVELYDFLKNLEKSAEDEKEEAFWGSLIEKIVVGVGLTGGLAAGMYFAPLGTILATGGSIIIGSTIYHIHDNIIEPVGETAGFFTKGFLNLKNWLFGTKNVKDPDKGLFGNVDSALFGDKSKENINGGLLETVRKLIFGDKYVVVLTKDQKKAFVNYIREKFCKLVRNKEWLDNDIIVFSVDIDPKVMQSDIKFDKVNFDLNYKENLKEYFKKIET